MFMERRAVGLPSLALAGIWLLIFLGTTPGYAAGNPGAIGFSAPFYSASAPDGVAVVVLTRTGGSSSAVSATFATLDAGAIAGANYTGTTGTLSWNDGDATPRTIMVPISATGTGGEFSVALLSATGAGFGPIIEAAVSIVPAPPPPPFGGARCNFRKAPTRSSEVIPH